MSNTSLNTSSLSFEEVLEELIVLISVLISILEKMVVWNCVSGPEISEFSRSNSIGHTSDCSTFFDIAPASNMIHGLFKLSRVIQKIPTVELSSSLAISEDHLFPFSMSLGVK
ncbi:hypothetical protein D3C85_1354500 [compost metagenome]